MRYLLFLFIILSGELTAIGSTGHSMFQAQKADTAVKNPTTIHFYCKQRRLVDSLRPTWMINNQIVDSNAFKNMDPNNIGKLGVRREDPNHPHGIVYILTYDYIIDSFKQLVKKASPQIYRQIRNLSYQKLYEKFNIKIIDEDNSYMDIAQLMSTPPKRITKAILGKREKGKKTLIITP